MSNDPLTETDLNETLERFGVMDRAHSSGCYALQLATPADDANTVLRSWVDHYDANPPDGFAARVAEAERFVYVGSHGKNVYTRMCEHVKDDHCGMYEKREADKSASIMKVWPVVDVVDIWPEENPGQAEYNHATELADDRTVVWTNGSYL